MQIVASLRTAPLACRALVALAADTLTVALPLRLARLPSLRCFECRQRLSLRSGTEVVASPTGRLPVFCRLAPAESADNGAHAAGETLSLLALIACRWQGKRLQILAALGTAPLACRVLVALAPDTLTDALAPPSAWLPSLRRFECRQRLSLRSGTVVVASPTGRLLLFSSATLCALGLTQSPRQGAMTLPSLRSGSRRCASICGGGALGAAPVVVSSRALRSFPCALAALVSLPRARARDSPPAGS